MAKKIYVVKKFSLTLSDGSVQTFDVGSHSVADEVAEHWFTKGFIGGEPEKVAQNKEVKALTDKVKELNEQLAEKDKAIESLKAEKAEADEKVKELNALLEEAKKNEGTSDSSKDKK